MNLNVDLLKGTITSLLSAGKGILAADQSPPSTKGLFDKINLETTPESRLQYRQGLFSTQNLNKHISGVILHEETFFQTTSEGLAIPQLLIVNDVVPGIKVDKGTIAMSESPEEKTTKGLEELNERLATFFEGGARFTKWRAVIKIGKDLPTKENIKQNSEDLSQYALACLNNGLVPIVEPEVLPDGKHDIQRCAEVTKEVLDQVFTDLKDASVPLDLIVLKQNMVHAGKENDNPSTKENVAKYTVETLKAAVPEELPGIVFLSGGQPEIRATENLNEMNKTYKNDLPWVLSFSFGRGLQESYVTVWQGKEENTSKAQEALAHRAEMNEKAVLGEYSSDEDTLAGGDNPALRWEQEKGKSYDY